MSKRNDFLCWCFLVLCFVIIPLSLLGYLSHKLKQRECVRTVYFDTMDNPIIGAKGSYCAEWRRK